MSPLGPAALERRLGLPEALGTSVAIISPTIGMAFNVVLVTQVAGVAAPLAFAFGTAVMIVVALSFVAFSRRQSHAGAAYAFIAHAFGAPLGVLAGWAMILVYTCFCAGLAALFEIFIVAALANLGIHAEKFGMLLAVGSIIGCAILAWRDVRLASRLMLALEAIAIAAILILTVVIFASVNAHGGWSLAPFSAHASPHGWMGLGFALVFAVLSFAGFEGAATLGEETRDPERTIPLAMIGSVLGSGLLFVIVSYAIVLGFGLSRNAELAQAATPLDDLSRRLIGSGFAIGLDLCCAISAFSCALGSLTSSARILFALGRGGLSPGLAKIDRVHHTPARAIILCASLTTVSLVAILAGTSAMDFYGNTATMATLAIILVYAGVAIGEAVEAARVRRLGSVALGLLGTAVLAWALLASVLPSSGPTGVVWAMAVAGWMAVGGLVLLLRPALRRWKA